MNSTPREKLTRQTSGFTKAINQDQPGRRTQNKAAEPQIIGGSGEDYFVYDNSNVLMKTNSINKPGSVQADLSGF